jgi:hypothetical protein
MKTVAGLLLAVALIVGCGGSDDSELEALRQSDRDELVSSDGWDGCYFDGVPMWGSVYVSDRSLYADFDVYVSDRSLYADLSVYPADRSLYADSCGRWWFTDGSAYADFTVYFTDRSLYADFDVYFTDRALYAGR